MSRRGVGERGGGILYSHLFKEQLHPEAVSSTLRSSCNDVGEKWIRIQKGGMIKKLDCNPALCENWGATTTYSTYTGER